MNNVTLVGVGGLPTDSGDAGHRLWDPYWHQRMGISDDPIVFDADLDQGTRVPDVLSHVWLERTAKRLLDHVKSKHKEGNQLVFFGENLGGIVLKRALVLADSDAAYIDIARDTCACVLHDVPHAASSHEAWTQDLVELVATSWRALPKDIWKSITSLPQTLDRLSYDFARVAVRFMVITVFRSDVDDDVTKSLGLAHERLVLRLLGQAVGFQDGESDTVSSIFGLLERAAAVTSKTRQYLRDLSSLGWPQAAASRGFGEDVEADLAKDLITHLANHEINIVALYEPSGVGKRSLLSHVYQQLISRQQPLESSAFFAFNEWDQNGRTVSAMLISVILQLLSCEPDLVPLVQRPDVLDSSKGPMARQTEANLWIQLRLIVRNSKCKRIRIAIDSINSCFDKEDRGFPKALFDLQPIASGRLIILCTADTDTTIPVDSTALGMVSVEVEKLPGLKAAKVEYQRRLADKLASAASKFAATRAELTICLAKSESFLHASLIVYRIQSAAESLSCPTRVRQDLDNLGESFDQTVLGIVAACPTWVATAVAWMLFAQRPLRTEELAVAVALRDCPASSTANSETVDDFIPRDMNGDLKRQLGPLVVARNDEVRLVHGSASVVLQGWLDKTIGDEVARNTLLTQQLLEYLKNCLDRVPVGGSWEELRGPSFGLLEYAFRHWHVHYKKAMGLIVPPLAPSPTILQVHDSALTLFTTTKYRCQLQPSHQDATSHSIEGSASPGSSKPVLLAARLGLLDVAVRLMDEPDSPPPTQDSNEPEPENTENSCSSDGSGESQTSDVVDVFHIACQFGFQDMVEYFIYRIFDKQVLARELALACSSGDETLFHTLLCRYRDGLGVADLPPELLCNACLAGHASLAGILLFLGADPNEPADAPPLHHAVERGYLDVVNLLLGHKANVMAVFQDKSTLLHHSIQHGYSDISLRLLQEPNIQDMPDEHGVTALHLAAEKGDVHIIRQILNLRPPSVSEIQLEEDGTASTDGETPTTKSDSPLHKAAANGHLEAAKALLNSGYDVDELDSEGQSALYLALRHDHRDVADHLLRYLSDREDKVKIAFGRTYAESELKQAIRHGNVSAVKELLRLGANPNGSDDSGSSPLVDAVKADHTEIVSALLESSASMTQTVDFGEDETILGETIGDGWLPQHFAAYYGSIHVMKALNTLLPGGFNGACTRSGHTPLHLAVFREHEQVVESMLSRHVRDTASVSDSARPDSPKPGTDKKDSRDGSSLLLEINLQTDEGITALHIAAASGNVHLAETLVASDALLEVADKSGKRAIHYAAAAKKNTHDMVHLLLQHGADVRPRDLDGMTPLHLAASGSSEDHEKAVRLLLRERARPNQVSDEGLTPLYLAASSGSVAVMRFLLHYGADVNAANDEGHTALHAAVSNGKPEMVTLLADADANLDVADDRGDTPLHGAARSENIEVATILIKRGASLNVTNTRRITPLQRAVMNASAEMAKLLLDNGADPNVPDEDGDTALMAAIMAWEPAIVKLLLDSQYKTKVDVINSRGQTPLMLALRSPGQLLPPLLSAKASVELCGDDGTTVLHMAAAQGVPDVLDIRPLLKYGKGHLDARDREGQAPIHRAARSNQKNMIKELRDAGADVAATDKQGRTAMHFAVRSMWAPSFEDTFKEFLRPGTGNKVNTPDLDGWTPLHWACTVDDVNLINLLLDHCETDKDRRDLILQEPKKDGWTAWAIADFYGTNKNREALIAALNRLREAGVKGIPANPPAVERGTQHSGYRCDDCGVDPILGLRFKCDSYYHPDFDLCFKCYWHHEDTHFPSGHTFTTHGEGPAEGPQYLSPTEQEPKSAVSTASVASSERAGSMAPPPPPPPQVIHPGLGGADDDGFPMWLRVASSSRRRPQRRPSTVITQMATSSDQSRHGNDSQTPG